MKRPGLIVDLYVQFFLVILYRRFVRKQYCVHKGLDITKQRDAINLGSVIYPLKRIRVCFLERNKNENANNN